MAVLCIVKIQRHPVHSIIAAKGNPSMTKQAGKSEN